MCQARQRVFRGMAGPCLKSLERYQVQVPVKRFFYHHTSCRISHPVRLIMNIMWLILYHIPGNSIPSFALPIYKTTCDSKPYLYRSVQYRYLITICVQLASLINDKQHDDNVRGCTAVVGEMMKDRWSSGAPVHVLHFFSTAAAAAAAAAPAAAVGGAASFCTYTNFLFHFPIDEI